MNRRPTPFLLVAAFLVVGCHHEHQEPQEHGKFLVTSPLRKDTELTRDYVAQIRAIQHIELRALEKGYLQGTFIDEGRQVAKGAKMFQIMPMIYQAEVQKADAEAQLSAIELRNTKLLADKNVVSPNELALARAKLNKAKAEVALASTHKSMTEMRAPFDGLVGRFHVRMGSLVDEGDLLTTLSDNSKVWVYFNVSEVEYLKYESQPEEERISTVKLQMADGQIFDQPGTVETIEADFNNQTGSLAFRATFPNPKGLLRHGETGKILMEVPLKNALLIPQKATFDVLDKKFVFVIDEKNVVHSRPITIAAEMPQVFAVASGLEEHDKILVEGLRKVRDGVTIEVDYKDPSDVFAHLEVPAE
ncbi:efflux RND transporter periplasmic adaptor subunit [Polyangium mundeleinium]|uniref:Efflux RND transporter periplasmic adaptor subunit n=1 Tax=Polyangium mundeleinium TaxID=2995306 RepID=A0ABT5EZ73_9BACT|nr:efflux RND transporter periplasmic adaptor subunit [Polyangium mundeleinium]MDC0746111.1 efflux RND transporter periplasmic adaptor subunit [Polyangium mundeleinium]